MSERTKVGEHPNQIIVVIDPKYYDGIVVSPGPELEEWLEGYSLENVDTCKNFPEEVGVYVATIERHFIQGYSEGYPAPGESDYWVELHDVRRVDVSAYITAPAT